MTDFRLTRRALLATLVMPLAAPLAGCGAAGPVVAFLLKLPWDKIATVVVSAITGYIAVKGYLDGKEVTYERKLTDDEMKRLKDGADVQATVELKDGTKKTVKPEVAK